MLLAHTFKEVPCFERLLRIVHSRPKKEDVYLCHRKRFSKNGQFLESPRKISNSPLQCSIHYKSRIRPRMEYRCHIWHSAAQSSLFSLHRVQKRLRGLVGDELFSTLHSYPPDEMSPAFHLLCRYCYGGCSDELYSLVLPV